MADFVRVPETDWRDICNAVRDKTGGASGLLSGDIAQAVSGIQAGGGIGISFGENTLTPNFLNLFYVLETGNCVTGEFALAEHLPNTETLVFDTGLSEITGIFYVDCDYAYTATGNAPEYGVWGLYMVNPNGLADVYAGGLSTYNTGASYYYPMGGVSSVFLTRATHRIDGGKLYATAHYNKNGSYTPFYRGHRYKWVAW